MKSAMVSVPYYVGHITYRSLFCPGGKGKVRLAELRRSNGYRLDVDVSDLSQKPFNTVEELIEAVEKRIQKAVDEMRAVNSAKKVAQG